MGNGESREPTGNEEGGKGKIYREENEIGGGGIETVQMLEKGGNYVARQGKGSSALWGYGLNFTVIT